MRRCWTSSAAFEPALPPTVPSGRGWLPLEASSQPAAPIRARPLIRPVSSYRGLSQITKHLPFR